MAKRPYPLVPSPSEKGWFERHPLWKIPFGCLGLIFLLGVFVGGLLSIVEGSFHNSSVFQQATARARNSERVREEIGQPMKGAWLIAGSIQLNGSSGNADLSIPITGPKGKGTIRAVAVKSAGVWQFDTLQVQVEGKPGCIDLLVPAPPQQQ
jgi:hypothetical protein